MLKVLHKKCPLPCGKGVGTEGFCSRGRARAFSFQPLFNLPS